MSETEQKDKQGGPQAPLQPFELCHTQIICTANAFRAKCVFSSPKLPQSCTNPAPLFSQLDTAASDLPVLQQRKGTKPLPPPAFFFFGDSELKEWRLVAHREDVTASRSQKEQIQPLLGAGTNLTQVDKAK